MKMKSRIIVYSLLWLLLLAAFIFTSMPIEDEGALVPNINNTEIN